MADNDDLMAEFQEFLTQKRASEEAEKESEDFEIEIWDEKGRGVRTKRSHAKPFLQSLGIDVDPEPPADDDKEGDKPKARKSSPPKSIPANASVRKYFTKPTGK